MCVLSFSARSKYSSTFFLMSTRSFSFFSSVDTWCGHGSARRPRQHRCGTVRTFEGHHEVVESILILLICFSVVLADILVYCLLDNLDCALMVSSWTEECGVSSGGMWSVGSLLTSRKLPFDIRRECGFELEGIGTKSSCFGKFGSCHCHP